MTPIIEKLKSTAPKHTGTPIHIPVLREYIWYDAVFDKFEIFDEYGHSHFLVDFILFGYRYQYIGEL